jgi:hypothetical protein
VAKPLEDTIRELPRLQIKVRRYFEIRGYAELGADAAQDYAVHLLEGKGQHQTTDQFCIDYLRKRSGHRRTRHYEMRKSLLNPAGMDVVSPSEFSTTDPSVAIESKDELIKLLSFVSDPKERDMLILRMQGDTCGEIAKKYRVTESRVWQIVEEAGSVAQKLMERRCWTRKKNAERQKRENDLRSVITAILNIERKSMDAKRIRQRNKSVNTQDDTTNATSKNAMNDERNGQLPTGNVSAQQLVPITMSMPANSEHKSTNAVAKTNQLTVLESSLTIAKKGALESMSSADNLLQQLDGSMKNLSGQPEQSADRIKTSLGIAREMVATMKVKLEAIRLIKDIGER